MLAKRCEGLIARHCALLLFVARNAFFGVEREGERGERGRESEVEEREREKETVREWERRGRGRDGDRGRE